MNLAELLARIGDGRQDTAEVLAGRVQSVTARRGTMSITFGTDDIRDCSAGAEVVTVQRVYDDPPYRRSCGGRHKSAASALRCARRMARGWWSQANGASWVEVVPAPPSQKRQPKAKPVGVPAAGLLDE